MDARHIKLYRRIYKLCDKGLSQADVPSRRVDNDRFKLAEVCNGLRNKKTGDPALVLDLFFSDEKKRGSGPGEQGFVSSSIPVRSFRRGCFEAQNCIEIASGHGADGRHSDLPGELGENLCVGPADIVAVERSDVVEVRREDARNGEI